VNANYLFPAGSSVVHPHLQLLATPLPYSWQARALEATRRHRERHGSAFHDELAREEERIGSRWVGRTGAWAWFASFAPQGSNEIAAAHARAADFAELGDGDVRDLAAGLSRVLALYGELGHLSFNFSLVSARGGGEAGARCHLRVVSRQNPAAAYRNDDYFLQKLLQTEIIATLPEALAGRLRPAFPESAATAAAGAP
jgi:galactose-1-phosphate uridylyltransferase